MTQHILIIEDEIKIASLLQDYLNDAGYLTHMIHRGDDALDWVKQNSTDMILLDLMIPGIDGMEVCKTIRRDSDVPIIMITARIEEIDRLLGLELGADDYICKPFSPREVVARVKAVLRRQNKSADMEADRTADEKNGLILDEGSFSLCHLDKKIELTAVEFKLIQTLYNRPGHIFSRSKLIDTIYNDHRVVSDRTVDSHIKKLRKKLSSIDIDGDVIHSVYGAGYKYE